MKYYVFGKMPLGTGYLHFENGKRVWGRYDDLQYFTADEIDAVLDKIGSEWDWKCYDTERNLYREHKSHWVYI